MTQKKNYSRYFIILQEDEKGYSQASDKMSSGYAKIEIKNDKCKISYYVQNLKKDSMPYYMILICTKKDEKKLINVGELNMDDNGRAEICYEYTSDNIAQTGISIDKISGAAIVKFIEKKLISIMSGYSSTEVPEWRGYEIVKGDTKEEQPDFEENTKSRSDEKSVFDEYEENIEKEKSSEMKNESDTKARNKDIKDENNVIEKTSENHEDDTKNQKSKKNEEEKNDIEHINDVSTYNIENMRNKESKSKKNAESSKQCKSKESNNEEKIEKIMKDNENDLENMPKGAVGEFFKAIAKEYEEVFDICDEIKRCRWFKVPVKNPMDMADTSNYNKYTVVYYPMINYFPYIKKYGHFMLGYKCDSNGNMKYLVYAVPGTKSKEEQPFEGKSGFVTWQALKNGENKEDNFGYWIMFYDFRTSTIVIPIK